jgi:sugar transferase (PEP-CTERM/EpsH1 system associated)
LKILFLSQRVPEPPNKGDKIRSCHLMRRLAARHEVHVACLLDEAAEQTDAEVVGEWAASVTWRLRRAGESVLRGATCALTGRPISAGWFRSGALARDLAALRARHDFDVAVAYCSSMAPYLDDFTGPRVIDFVDVDSEKWRQYAERGSFPRNAVHTLEHRLLRRYERGLLDQYDRAVIISEAERDLLAQFADVSRLDVVANGVDVDGFARSDSRPTGPELVFVGAMDYFANAEGVVWFANEVLPVIRERVPDATLRIVGRRPGPEVRALSGVPGVTVVGEVADVRPELWRASLAVVPLRIAQGLQNKVLEAMAAGVPVVSSPAAVRALGPNEGAWLEAERPEEWARAISALVGDSATANTQAACALARVRGRFSWDGKAREYEQVLVRAVEARASGEPVRGGTA